MASNKAVSWMYAEKYIEPSEAVAAAQQRAQELGVGHVSDGKGAALRFLASVTGAVAVAEIGTGAGVSGLWLTEGMKPNGILTSIDCEPEYQRAASKAFKDAGIASARIRLISGHAMSVLPRMSAGGYCLVFVDAGTAQLEETVEQALRMLRPGGVLAVCGALWRDRVGDPAQRDAHTVAMRTLGTSLLERKGLTPLMLTCGDGLLAAVKN